MKRDYIHVSGSSPVPSDRQYFHTHKAVGVLGQDHGIPVQANFAEAGSKVVGGIGPAEGVNVDVCDVVVLAVRGIRCQD